MVSVSAINRIEALQVGLADERSESIRLGFGFRVRFRHRLGGDAVATVRPLRQVRSPAALAAERPPMRIHRTLTAQDAQPSLAHPTHSNQFTIQESAHDSQ